MKLFKVFAAAALGLGLMGVTAQAATVTIFGSQNGPTAGGTVNDPFAAGIDASFELPTDFEVGISSLYRTVDGDDNQAIDQVFEFFNVNLTAVNALFTVNTPADFTDLSFEWSDGVNPSIFISGGDASTAIAFALLPTTLYTITVTGMTSLTGGSNPFGQYDISVSAVPIPGAAWLFGTALLGGGIVVSRRRRRRAATAAA